MKHSPQWATVFGLFCLAAAASATPITAPDATCTGGAQVITIAEGQAEAGFLLSCPGFTLAPSVDGKTAVFLEPDGTVSDYVLLANVNGSANFVFFSDTDLGPPLIPPLPILTTVVEPNPFVVIATSATGVKLQFTFSSDLTEGPNVPSETITIAVVPEPASLTLLGLGGLIIVCWHVLRRRTAKTS